MCAAIVRVNNHSVSDACPSIRRWCLQVQAAFSITIILSVCFVARLHHRSAQSSPGRCFDYSL